MIKIHLLTAAKILLYKMPLAPVAPKKYKFNNKRIISLWALPAFFLILFFVLFFSKFKSVSDADTIDLVAWLCFLFVIIGPFAFLFFNHLKLARHTELTFEGKKLWINQGNESDTIDFSDIIEINKYYHHKRLWGSIVKWDIITADKKFTISSLTISAGNFEYYFWNKITSYAWHFPRI